MSDDRAARAAARSAWPTQLTTLEDDTSDDLSEVTTSEERLAMMWELAVRAWSLSGRSIPTYARSDMPGRVIRPDA